MNRHLPIHYERKSSLLADGRRNYVHPADVHGRFDRARMLGFALLLAFWAALPWIELGGHPAVFLDIEARKFFLFGHTFNAQDVWLVFFLLSGVGFALIVATALFGRVWCGYACPHTVFLEAIFRPIERYLEGPRNERVRRNAGPLSFDKLWRKTVKHAVYLLAAFLVAHVIVSYFVSLPRLYAMVLGEPGEHPAAFAWATGLTAALYFNFSWFREQMCLILCPYGRLQSVLTDRDTLLIGYDVRRGEPRGKAGTEGAGDCVSCDRCVVVCPTGIDIRNGLQIDCVGCARCIDACDDVMTRLGRARGLVRYDSQKGLDGEPRRFLRPRLGLYAVLGVAGLVAAGLALHRSRGYEANLLRLRGAPPYVLDGTLVRNSFEVHLVNKRAQRARFTLTGKSGAAVRYTIAMPSVVLSALENRSVPVFVSFERGAVHDGDHARILLQVPGEEPALLEAPLIAPGAR
jgi:cytochrome c oxidase accessory protein FixG